MPFSVINTQQYLTQEAKDYLAANGCAVRYRHLERMPHQEMLRELAGVEGVIAGSEVYDEGAFQAAEGLKIVARTGTGYNWIDVEAATRHGVWVTITAGATSQAVADFTLGLILSLLRNIHRMAQDMKSGHWNQFRGRELGSLTLGVVGAGSIGQEVVRRARGFAPSDRRPPVLAYDVRADPEFARQWEVQYVPLDQLMAESDVISINVALTRETEGLIDRRRLGLMKQDAYLVNTSRATVVDKEALIDALRAGRIAGAAIDVHDPAPCSPDDPLVCLDNVLATPWSAYNTDQAIERMSIMAARDLVAALKGERPQHPVNQPGRNG